jgi:hypothetical protein
MSCLRFFRAVLRTLSLAGILSILVAGGAFAHGKGHRGHARIKTVRINNTIHPIIVGRHRHRHHYHEGQRYPYPGRPPIGGPLPPQPKPTGMPAPNPAPSPAPNPAPKPVPNPSPSPAPTSNPVPAPQAPSGGAPTPGGK